MNSADQSGTVLISNTHNIVWKVNDEETLTICPQFNPNPETGGNIAAVVAFHSDADGVPTRGGIIIHIDYDIFSDRITRFQSNKCDCLRERLEKILSQHREPLKDWLQKATKKASEDLKQCVFDSDLCDGGMVGYHELIPGASTGNSEPAFTAGMILIRNGERWWVSDMYCASPECHCCETLFVFYPMNDLKATKRDAVAVDYKMNGLYTIRDIDKGQITEKSANDLVKEWIEKKPVWFTDDEIRSRSQQIKRVMGRTMKQQKMSLNTGNKRQTATVGRNDPCPCGSARKYKMCCGR